jgi:DNA polymerase-3 subunit epsilon
MNIIALDFETACPGDGNACQLGLAWIEGDRVVRVEERYIRPRDMLFTFSWCHGITEEHVWDKPEFPEVFAEFRAELDGALMLAHNAEFDAKVLRGCVDSYGLQHPQTEFLCTVKLARAVWPELPSKSLSSMAEHLGLRFQHHNAAEDARVCAEVAIAAARIMGAFSVADIVPRLDAFRRLRRDALRAA